MTLRHLHIFVSVYEHKSITKAANTLHIAQPSVSLAIKELGEYYGVQLFDRIGRGITPTEAAKHLYGYAIHIVSLFNEMEQHIKNWDNIGTLRIGASITIGTHILPELIKEYQKHNPDLRLEVIVNKSSAIEQHILDNKIDIHPLWESSSTQAIVQGVAMGLGVSVLPEMMIKKDILEHRVSYLSFPKTSKKEPKSYFASKQTLDKKHEIIYRILYVIFRKIGETM